MPERLYFGKFEEVIDPPNLIEVQSRSYDEFLQKDVSPGDRSDTGLQAVFREVFPIKSYDEAIELDFVTYDIEEPKITSLESLRNSESFSAALYVTFKLKDETGTKKERVYMGELPMMTRRGTFIINGAERVIVSQLHRSPGICFETSEHLNGKTLHSFRIIPDRGSWLEVQFDTNDLLYVYLDRRRRRRKFLATTFLRVLGYPTDRDIVSHFYSIENLALNSKIDEAELGHKVPFEDILDGELVIAKAYEPLTAGIVKQLLALGQKKLEVIDGREDEILLKSLRKDPAKDEESALKDIYRKLRPGDPPTASNARALLKRLFFDAKKYDLTRVGRYKINQKLGIGVDSDQRIMVSEDFLNAVRYILKLKKGEGVIDDIDHLGSRRVRAVGELLANQCRVGLARTERLVKERMTLFDVNIEGMTPQKLINPKALSAVVRDFFGRSQLSQFMDQTNPLAELTHKRRLSALGPGGLNRDRAGFEVRDVHPSHYGRICPIETPEGPNIGLINSMCTYARINEFGFIETPYRKVKKGKVTNEIEYLTADQEENYLIAQASNVIDNKGKFDQDRIDARERGEFIESTPDEVHYMDVSPKQLVSVAAGLIPFLEHDDANRALMGSNMQRQGVPLLVSESPLVGTGLEGKAARDSRAVVVSEADGIVAAATAEIIITTPDGKLPVSDEKFLSEPEIVKTNVAKGIFAYPLRKFMRSNAGTCINQKPIVKAGQKIKKGHVLADGPNTEDGELAIGRNVLVAFMPWNGYNFEDAIVISERVVKDDVYTSIHISEFDVAARDTKLGPEEITRDIPNVGEEALRNLDHDGIIRIGAEVRPGDILIGKITPKSETELAPEERLLRAIFGEKAADVKDTSLRVPSGCTGIVQDVRVSSHGLAKKRAEKIDPVELKKHLKKINDEHKKKADKLTDDLTEKLSDILLGEKIPLDVVNAQTGEIIIPANRKITKTLLRKLASVHDHIEIDPSPIRNKIVEIINSFESRFQELDTDRERKLDQLESGDDVDPGVIKEVKVFVAAKRKLSVGDKMAGRHGNKGVVATIVPEEDMPYLHDGTPVDICLNPLGVPSRMNVGQVLETHLGVAARALGFKVATPIFDGIKEDRIWEFMSEAKKVDGVKMIGDGLKAVERKPGQPEGRGFTWIGDGKDGSTAGKSTLYDGRTGEAFHNPIVVGEIYMLKLGHLVADKIHARAVGPYSLVTQQPLGGKAQYGGQRFGEMEVWALEAYGAAYTLQEILTVKSDDVQGRTRIYEAIVKGDNNLEAGTPESFNVLIKEMQSLGLDVRPGRQGQTSHGSPLPGGGVDDFSLDDLTL
ncbi:DNA-directed RNA polymerase subunit beta [Luteolibacter sp. AS25]|uniref:DNA-directed RNA polymerase subunit beta n=1 Tax=Luteolibacter sp. AS25 TaxID=3135776 RepID=UPI00398B6F7C